MTKGRNLSKPRKAEKNQALYSLIRKRGGPPLGTGKVAFWESVQMEWNRYHTRDKYKTWKGVKVAYDRIMERLENRLEGGEQ